MQNLDLPCAAGPVNLVEDERSTAIDLAQRLRAVRPSAAQRTFSQQFGLDAPLRELGPLRDSQRRPTH